jgi:inhibitor of KinA
MKIFPLGENALTIEFGNTISVELNNRALLLATHFEQHPFSGFIEAVPAYASATIFYDTIVVRSVFPRLPTAFEAVRYLVEVAESELEETSDASSRLIEIPVSFDKDSALDLEYVAEHSGLSSAEIIGVFTSQTYRVYMLGFLPGFAYMGEVDERIAVPRKETPRVKVPKGSVGIAGRQTGIYPLESPGGWQIIGRTEIEMFTLDSEFPCLLRPGDNVKFVDIGER